MATKKRHEIRYNYWEHMGDSTESRGKRRIPFFRSGMTLRHAEFLEHAAQDALQHGDILGSTSLWVQSRLTRRLGESQQQEDAKEFIEDVALLTHKGRRH